MRRDDRRRGVSRRAEDQDPDVVEEIAELIVPPKIIIRLLSGSYAETHERPSHSGGGPPLGNSCTHSGVPNPLALSSLQTSFVAPPSSRDAANHKQFIRCRVVGGGHAVRARRYGRRRKLNP